MGSSFKNDISKLSLPFHSGYRQPGATLPFFDSSWIASLVATFSNVLAIWAQSFRGTCVYIVYMLLGLGSCSSTAATLYCNCTSNLSVSAGGKYDTGVWYILIFSWYLYSWKMWCRKHSESRISAPAAPCVCVFWWKMLEVLSISKRQDTLLCCSLLWFRWIATIYHMCFSHSIFPLLRAFATPSQCSNRAPAPKKLLVQDIVDLTLEVNIWQLFSGFNMSICPQHLENTSFTPKC